MPKNLQIIKYPSQILREKTFEVSSINSELSEFIKNLTYSMYFSKGAGLSAIQVGRFERIFIIDEHFALSERPIVVINPVILEESESFSSLKEGCLSFPDKYETISRPKSIKVRYIDENEQGIDAEFSGFTSRIFLHEYDHLENKLMIDHIPNFKRDRYEKEKK